MPRGSTSLCTLTFRIHFSLPPSDFESGIFYSQDLSLKSFPCLSLLVFDDNRACHSIVHIGIRVPKRNRHSWVGEVQARARERKHACSKMNVLQCTGRRLSPSSPFDKLTRPSRPSSPCSIPLSSKKFPFFFQGYFFQQFFYINSAPVVRSLPEAF